MANRYGASDHTFALCAYGESSYLEECLTSLLSQTVQSNVIIATSTPNDCIRRLAGKYGVPLYENDGESGISHDWNCAVSHCVTPLVTIAHQDDIYLPDYVERTLEAFNSSSCPLISFTDYGELRGGRTADSNRLLKVKRILLAPLKLNVFKSSRFVRRRILSLGSSICCPSVTFCVDSLPTPLFLSDMKCDLDWEAWERFSKLKGDFLYVPNILMRHRIHEESETTALIEDNTRSKEDLIMLEKFWPEFVARFLNGCYAASQNSNNV